MEHLNPKEKIFPKFDKILKVSLEICDNLLEFNNQQNIKKDIVQKASDITIDEDNNLRFIKQANNNITTNLIPQIEQHNISTNNEQGVILPEENIFPKFDKILKVSLETCDNLVKLNNQQKIKKDIVQNDSDITIDEDNALSFNSTENNDSATCIEIEPVSSQLMLKNSKSKKKKSYNCSHCKSTFSTLQYLKEHKKIPRNFQIFSNQLDLKSLNKTDDQKVTFNCGYCSKVFTVKSNLTVHITTHTRTSPFICDLCHSSFTEKQDFMCHMRRHTGYKPYSCPICIIQFSRTSLLDYHKLKHTGFKLFKCEICDKNFSRKSYLVYHQKHSHTGEEVFEPLLKNPMRAHDTLQLERCNMYDKKYSHKSSLNRHECEICNRDFYCKFSLRDHIIVYMTKGHYECNLCKSTFPTALELEIHTESHCSSTISLQTSMSKSRKKKSHR